MTISIGQELRQRKKHNIQMIFNGATVFFKRGEIDAAYDSLIKLQGMAAAFHLVDDALYRYATDAADTLAQFLAQPDTHDFTAWALFKACKVLAGLKGALDADNEHLDQLLEVNTDIPDDFVARCKASFTDALLNELEYQGYHSPTFDRLIALRNSYTKPAT